MPGPKMGPRPADFNEDLVKQSPTYAKWEKLQAGEKLKYACREFIKGHDQDEERLMRRIMIARRNNLRDHEVLKRARQKLDVVGGDSAATATPPEQPLPLPPPQAVAAAAVASTIAVAAAVATTAVAQPRKRRPAFTFTDSQVMKEMDVQAVEATRSYKAWMELKEGQEFVYNQKYIKGKEGHDWLIRKNIWRRMRYRRENKKMVHKLRQDPQLMSSVTAVTTTASSSSSHPQPLASQTGQSLQTAGDSQKPTACDIVDQALTPVMENQGTQPAPPNGAGTKRPVSEGSVINVEGHHHQPTKLAKVILDMTMLSNNQNNNATMDSLQAVKVENMALADAATAPLQEQQGLDMSGTLHHHDPHDDNDAALTAAAAVTASGAAEDLVELSAVEAAVAAAASYVHYQNQEHDNDGDDDDDDQNALLGHNSAVHNPLEAAANAAALDSAAKLAAAATAQESSQHLDNDDNDMQQQQQEAMTVVMTPAAAADIISIPTTATTEVTNKTVVE